MLRMDEITIETIKKALSCIEQELGQYEWFLARCDVLRKSRDELKELLATVPPAEKMLTASISEPQVKQNQ